MGLIPERTEVDGKQPMFFKVYLAIVTVIVMFILYQWVENGRYVSTETVEGTVVLDTRTGTRFFYHPEDKPYWEKLEFMKSPVKQQVKLKRRKSIAE